MTDTQATEMVVVEVVADCSLQLGETRNVKRPDGVTEVRCHLAMVPIMEMMLGAIEGLRAEGCTAEGPAMVAEVVDRVVGRGVTS